LRKLHALPVLVEVLVPPVAVVPEVPPVAAVDTPPLAVSPADVPPTDEAPAVEVRVRPKEAVLVLESRVPPFPTVV